MILALSGKQQHVENLLMIKDGRDDMKKSSNLERELIIAECIRTLLKIKHLEDRLHIKGKSINL
eukprot:CAMPEP_0172519966 /NCGR_PEP_ID=MMETSP1066-20121228/291725_1 /TAXON_ID=671091 /ORGANISM="Coscinodiscus wailesii, Strain CCMP2513" /LENGTH=63 /DNA_ID=CAMNT_0013302641 /DNA_START=183 /DNA_END=374 /DNA_ORIENTATION=+